MTHDMLSVSTHDMLSAGQLWPTGSVGAGHRVSRRQCRREGTQYPQYITIESTFEKVYRDAPPARPTHNGAPGAGISLAAHPQPATSPALPLPRPCLSRRVRRDRGKRGGRSGAAVQRVPCAARGAGLRGGEGCALGVRLVAQRHAHEVWVWFRLPSSVLVSAFRVSCSCFVFQV